MDHVCTHVTHLDLVDISQDMSATVRLMGTPNPMKKYSNRSMLQPQNPKIHGNVPRFRPGKKNFILIYIPIDNHWTDHSSILTYQPIHEACSGL